MAKKKAFLSVRMAPEERERLLRLCRESGLSVSALIRSRIDGVEIRPREPEELHDLYVEINRIGNNVNQIARACNAGMTAPDSAAEQALFLLRKVYALLERVADG